MRRALPTVGLPALFLLACVPFLGAMLYSNAAAAGPLLVYPFGASRDVDARDLDEAAAEASAAAQALGLELVVEQDKRGRRPKTAQDLRKHLGYAFKAARAAKASAIYTGVVQSGRSGAVLTVVVFDVKSKKVATAEKIGFRERGSGWFDATLAKASQLVSSKPSATAEAPAVAPAVAPAPAPVAASAGASAAASTPLGTADASASPDSAPTENETKSTDPATEVASSSDASAASEAAAEPAAQSESVSSEASAVAVQAKPAADAPVAYPWYADPLIYAAGGVVGVSGLLLSTGALFGGLALADSASLEEADPSAIALRDELRSQAILKSTVADSLLASGAAAALVGGSVVAAWAVTRYVLEPAPGEPEDPPATAMGPQ